ncbi:MAG: GspH/FimT family pseudopilin [Acidiferrobacterales bacterium]|nr:GspH/FimT family pseudopilin [Acidiferrobacterales bacterium]
MSVYKTTKLNSFSSKRQGGFNLLEVVIVMAIIAIATTIAIPSFTTFIANKRIEDQAFNLFTMLKQTRNSAITSNTPSLICRSAELTVDRTNPVCRTNFNNTERNIPILNGTPNWNAIIYAYSVPSGTALPTPIGSYNNLKLQNLADNNAERQTMLQSVREQGNENITVLSSTAGVHVMGFDNQGALINPAPIRIAVCDDRGEEFGRIIEINASGFTTLTSTDPSNANRDCSPTAL